MSVQLDGITFTQPNMGGPGAPGFTCNTCGLMFGDASYQRDHMRTDWHRYNLKRRVAQLPPITQELFDEKMELQKRMQEDAEENTSRGSSNRSTGQRQVTKKELKRQEKARKRMQDNDQAQIQESVKNMSISDEKREPADAAEEDEVEAEVRRRKINAVEIPSNVCLVDGNVYDTVEQNVEYMAKTYGLFIPEPDYLVDLEGLMTYLGEKVGFGNVCLACSFQGKNLESVRAHMISKSHVRIPYETTEEKLEISEFYDFTASYDNIEDGREADVKLGEDAGEDNEDWEEVDSEDEDYLSDDESQIQTDGWELALAPGIRAGHRSLQRYFKQNIQQRSVPDGQGTVMAVDPRTAGGLRTLDPVEFKQQKAIWKDLKKSQNVHFRRDKHINQQRHFRDELLQ